MMAKTRKHKHAHTHTHTHKHKHTHVAHIHIHTAIGVEPVTWEHFYSSGTNRCATSVSWEGFTGHARPQKFSLLLLLKHRIITQVIVHVACQPEMTQVAHTV